MFASTGKAPRSTDGFSPPADAAGETAKLCTSIEIAAPIVRVWSILVDFAAYPSWNPFLTTVQGRLRRGARITVRVAPPGRPPLVIRPRLSLVRPPLELRWSGQVLAPGFFDGEHRFRIERASDRVCVLHQDESYSGVLAPYFGQSLIDSTRAGFEAMNRALKARAEAS